MHFERTSQGAKKARKQIKEEGLRGTKHSGHANNNQASIMDCW